jgi:hypothetical protein
MTYAIVPVKQSTPPADLDSHILAMYLLWARAPRTPNPDAEGFYLLGEIGQDRPKDWERLTPYSLARRVK